MDYTTQVRALASVIANVAPGEKYRRMQESCLFTAYEIRMFAWWTAKLRVDVEGSKVTLSYPAKIGRWSPHRLDAWATQLIESAMAMLEGSPHEIDYRLGVIKFERPGVTSYEI